MVARLKGKTAVITGGGGGIGKAVALAMAAEGAMIVVNDIGRDQKGNMLADVVVDEIKKAGGSALANYDNVGTMTGGTHIINTAINKNGAIDVLVNCAGNFQPKPTVELFESDWDSVMNVHVKGHFTCTRAALPYMIKQKNGRIVNISSRAAFGRIAGAISYSTAKAAILGFTTSLAIEMKQYGITANAILPSAMTGLFPSNDKKMRSDGFPYPESLEPDWVAPVIIYLATDQSQNVTGKFIYASGGDLCIFDRPLKPLAFIRKVGKWKIEELNKVFNDPDIPLDAEEKELKVISFPK